MQIICVMVAGFMVGVFIGIRIQAYAVWRRMMSTLEYLQETEKYGEEFIYRAGHMASEVGDLL